MVRVISRHWCSFHATGNLGIIRVLLLQGGRGGDRQVLREGGRGRDLLLYRSGIGCDGRPACGKRSRNVDSRWFG
jgi:hypothetical protein